jgi:hypothetical protein
MYQPEGVEAASRDAGDSVLCEYMESAGALYIHFTKVFAFFEMLPRGGAIARWEKFRFHLICGK